MKIAVGIIGLMLGLLVALQSCTLTGAAALGRNAEATQAGQIGIVVGFLFFLGGAFGFALPMVAMIMFLIAALFGFANAGVFTDMNIWAIGALILAAMSFFAWRSARKAKAAALAASGTTVTAAPAPGTTAADTARPGQG